MTEATKKIVRDALEDGYSWATHQANKARRAYHDSDMSKVDSESGETRQAILDSYEKSEAEHLAALKEVFPGWEPPKLSR